MQRGIITEQPIPGLPASLSSTACAVVFTSSFLPVAFFLCLWSVPATFKTRDYERHRNHGTLPNRFTARLSLSVRQQNGRQHSYKVHAVHGKSKSEELLCVNPQPAITDLSQATGTNRTHVPEHPNKVPATTFFDYAGQHRLSCAERLLRQTEMPTEGMAGRSGLDSRSTSRRAVLKRLGCAPSRYRPQRLPKGTGKEISLTR